jgi:3-oxoadipate enol-lactonase
MYLINNREGKEMKNISIIFCLIIMATSEISPFIFDSTSSIEIDSGYIKVEGGYLFYEEAGTGENIVLLHDGLIDRQVWDDQFLFLAKDYRVIRYDRLGYGKSSNPKSSYSNVDNLYQLFEQLNIDKAIIFGMSAGGGVSIDFTLRHPKKVSGLILVGAVVSGYGYSTHMFTRGGNLDPSLSPNNNLKKFITYFATEDPYEIYFKNITAKEKALKLIVADSLAWVTRHQFYVPPDRPAAKFLLEIKVPVLILVGEYDIPDVQAHAGIIEFGIPNAKREIVPNSGHLIPLEQPEYFNAKVLKFLNGQEFFNILTSQGVNAAVEYFSQRRKSEPDIILFDERELNFLGYKFLQDRKLNDAIELFKLNTITYPESWNTYDSLGEAYLKNGQNELAIENYKRSLELNPNNTNALEILKTINNTK